MSFLSPLVLWSLPISLIPLLTHLWIRRRGQKIEFSDLTLIKKIDSQTLSRSKLKNSLLIFLRSALLASIVFAYAKPIRYAARIKNVGEKKDGTQIAILVDESYSMGQLEGSKTRLSLLKTAAQKILKKLKPEDLVAIIPFSDRLEIPENQIQWESPALAAQRLSKTRLTYKGTNFQIPIQALSRLWPKQESAKKVALILSDAARHGFPQKMPLMPRSTLWLGIDWGKPPPNSYIVSVKPMKDDAAPARLSVQMKTISASSLHIRLLSGRSATPFPKALRHALARNAGWNARFNISANSQIKTRVFDFPKEEGRKDFIAGKASLRADNLTADDSYFFSWVLPRKPKILCLYGDPSFLSPPHSGYFIKKILGDSGKGVLPYSIDFEELGSRERPKLSGYRALILADFNTLPREITSQIKTFVDQGGGLWILPGYDSPLNAFSTLNSWAPASVGPLVQSESPGIRPGPTLVLENFRGFHLKEVAITSYHLLSLKQKAESLFQSLNGYPLLACDPKKPICVSAFSLGIRSSDLAARPAFVIWTETLLRKIAGKNGEIKEFNLSVGQSIHRIWNKDEAAPSQVLLKSPDGKRTILHLLHRALKSPPLLTPGLYELRSENSRQFYAINADRTSGESDLAPAHSPPWESLPVLSWPQDFLRAIHGKKIASHFLLIALILLILEMILAAQPRKKWIPPNRALSAFKISPFVILFLVSITPKVQAQNSDSLVWTQLKIGPDWDPYPEAYKNIAAYVSNLTSARLSQDRRIITLKDPRLFFSPLVILAGRRAPEPLTAHEIKILGDYLRAGGMLWIEDDSGISGGPFEDWVAQTLKRVFPQLTLTPVNPNNVIFKTFFLLREPGGLLLRDPALKSIDYNERAAVLYSRDDLLGVWAKDALGNPLYPAIPGGLAQREAGKRLTLNIIFYALTGDYKADAVHQPYLIQKMRSGIP